MPPIESKQSTWNWLPCELPESKKRVLVLYEYEGRQGLERSVCEGWHFGGGDDCWCIGIYELVWNIGIMACIKAVAWQHLPDLSPPTVPLFIRS